MKRISIVDGYVDEPTCLGVPPYISPYPRYIAGAIASYGSDIQLNYFTIDQIRQNKNLIKILDESNIIILISGMVVPGKYLLGYPVHPKELLQMFSTIQRPLRILCGPAAIYGFGISGGKKPRYDQMIKKNFDLIITGDPEIVISECLKKDFQLNQVNSSLKRKNADYIHAYAVKGAFIVKQHPNYPFHLIAEIETYRGCPRSIHGGCSFCIEPLKGLPDYRSIKAIHDEIRELYKMGIRHFRIGNQPCLFSYKAHFIGRDECPRPNPEAIKSLFAGIRRIAPKIKTLHIDNVNPGVVNKYPEESSQIIQTIIAYHTSGDVAALGVESVDNEVIKQNNLKAKKNEVYNAIKLFNRYGSERGTNGLPELLPGLNFVFGLKGESKKTFHEDFNFLKRIVNDNLLIRRINLRQVIPLMGTPMESIGDTLIKRHKKEFQSFKYKVKINIEKPLLQRLIPKDTLLTDVITELSKGNITFGRQLGSYPILVGIPGKYPLQQSLNVKIIDYGFRSVTGLPYPLNINTCPRKTLESIQGIGKKRVMRILQNRPLKSTEDIKEVIEDEEVSSYLISMSKL